MFFLHETLSFLKELKINHEHTFWCRTPWKIPEWKKTTVIHESQRNPHRSHSTTLWTTQKCPFLKFMWHLCPNTIFCVAFIYYISRLSALHIIRSQVKRIIVQFYDGNQRGTTEMIFFLYFSFNRWHQVAALSFDAIISCRCI